MAIRVVSDDYVEYNRRLLHKIAAPLGIPLTALRYPTDINPYSLKAAIFRRTWPPYTYLVRPSTHDYNVIVIEYRLPYDELCIGSYRIRISSDGESLIPQRDNRDQVFTRWTDMLAYVFREYGTAPQVVPQED